MGFYRAPNYKNLKNTEEFKKLLVFMCIIKWRTASLKTMNNVLDFNNLLVRAVNVKDYMSALFSKLNILYIESILKVFLIRESYITAGKLCAIL